MHYCNLTSFLLVCVLFPLYYICVYILHSFFFYYKNIVVNNLIHKGFHMCEGLGLSLDKFLEEGWLGQRIYAFIIFIEPV